MAKIKKEKINLEERFKELNKKYSSTVLMGSQIEPFDEAISTGSLSLDIALGTGGIPVSFKELGEDGFKKSKNGKVIEIWGWQSTGKSTLTQTIMGNAQKDGRNVLLINSENSLSTEYAQNLGLDTSKLYVIQIDQEGGEEAYKKAQDLIDTGDIDIVVVDSYNKLRPKKELINRYDSGQMGNFAKLMGEVTSNALNNCAAYGTTTIFVGQVREKMGVMFGSPETKQGGNALGFDAHIIMKTSRSTTNDNSITDEDDEKIANLHKVKIEKNKLGNPFKSAEFMLYYGTGIDQIQEIIDLAPRYLENTKIYGKTFTFKGTKYEVQEFKNILTDNEEFFKEVREEILQAGLKKKVQVEVPEEIIKEELINQIANEIE